jgi:small subunit ribosomal protein S4e
MPNFWPVKKKNIRFIARPLPGSHKREYGASMQVLLKDILGVVENAKEARYLLKNTEVLKNGKRVINARQLAGLFDIIEFKETKEKFMLLLSDERKPMLIPKKDSTLFLKVVKKTQLGKDKFQISFFNGMTSLVDAKLFKATSINDSLLFDYDKKKIADHLPLKEGVFVYVFNGNYTGKIGQVKGFTHYNGLAKDLVELEIDKESRSTVKSYCYPIATTKEGLKSFM